jgi:nucleoside-diphosphate-sugar epimerase
LIRWIRENLGTAPRDEVGEGAFEILDVRHLVDKGGNSTDEVLKLVKQGVQALQNGQSLVVCCDLGISRSNAIAAGILSQKELIPFDLALQEVIAKTGEKEIKLDLAESVRIAVGGEVRAFGRHTVLVTGATGFIGRSLVERLKTTCQVLSPPSSELNLEDGAVALSDYCVRKHVGQIVHLAHPRKHTNSAAAASSMLMLRSVLDTCRLLNIRLVFVSCWTIYSGYKTAALLVDEATPVSAKGISGEIKLMEETIVDLYAIRNEIKRTICRLTQVYGLNGQRPHFIKSFHNAILSGQTVRTHKYRNGIPSLDLLHVSDAVEGIARAVAHNECDVFHFGSGHLTSTTDIALSIRDLVGLPIAHEEVEIADYTSNIAFPADKARRVLNWFAEVPVELGLARLLTSNEEVVI